MINLFIQSFPFSKLHLHIFLNKFLIFYFTNDKIFYLFKLIMICFFLVQETSEC